jgi:hypothetical protein
MAKKNNTILWLAVLGVGGYLLYKNSATTATTSTTNLLPAPGDTAGGNAEDLNPIGTPITAVISPVQTVSVTTANAGNAPVTQNVTTDGTPLPAGITQDMYNKVMTWAYADGRGPIKVMANNLIPSEYAGMYDIIVNQWGANAKATAAQTKFWNDLREKYDPTHKVW